MTGYARRSAAVLALLGALAGCSRSSGGASPTAPGACAAGSVCFNVFAGAPGLLGATDLVVVWESHGPGGEAPPSAQLLAHLSGRERGVVIPLSQVQPPQAPPPFNQKWGYVFVVPKGADPLRGLDAAVGVARMMFVDAAGTAETASLFRTKFPAGIAEGVAPYFMQKDGTFDDFVLARPGAVFDLVICPANNLAGCHPPFPNPS